LGGQSECDAEFIADRRSRCGERLSAAKRHAATTLEEGDQLAALENKGDVAVKMNTVLLYFAILANIILALWQVQEISTLRTVNRVLMDLVGEIQAVKNDQTGKD
jgi:hypothetical protein